jgi:thiol-disulfide isomerase/thioredoxin
VKTVRNRVRRAATDICLPFHSRRCVSSSAERSWPDFALADLPAAAYVRPRLNRRASVLVPRSRSHRAERMRSLAASVTAASRVLCCAGALAGVVASADGQTTRIPESVPRHTRATAPGLSADTVYVPGQTFPNGREIVAVYFGANWCGPCRSPATKAAILRMKPLLATQAKAAGADFAAMVVALDRSFADGAAFIKDLGAFDEYSIGGDLASTAAQAYIWSDSLAIPAVPQVIVFERDVSVQRGRPMTFGPRHVLARVAGDSIPGWVRIGAPLHLTAISRAASPASPAPAAVTTVATTLRSAAPERSP